MEAARPEKLIKAKRGGAGLMVQSTQKSVSLPQYDGGKWLTSGPAR